MKKAGLWAAVVLPILLAVPVSFYVGQATYAAGPGSAVLIDPDTEACVRKLITRRFCNRIAATDEQRQQVEALFESTADQTRPLREQLRAGAADMADLFASQNATDDQLSNKAHELRALHEKVQDQRLAALLKVRKILTKEQRQKIDERVKDMLINGAAPRRVGALLDSTNSG